MRHLGSFERDARDVSRRKKYLFGWSGRFGVQLPRSGNIHDSFFKASKRRKIINGLGGSCSNLCIIFVITSSLATYFHT